MRLYHAPRTRSLRVLWALEETGASYELTVLTPEDRSSDEHRARHPLGKVPALDDDGGFLFESGALCLHVADSYPDANLIGPPGSHERGLVYQWVLYAFSELEPGFAGFVGNRETDPEQAERAKERFRTAAGAVERALEGHEFLVADRFTVADVVYGEFLGVCRNVGLIETLPNVNAYVDRLEARPARRRADAAGLG